jgi:hydroxyacylglutathione hydrolase
MSVSLEVIRTVALGFVNYVYLLIDNITKKTAIIDPSWEFNKITSKIEEMNLIPEMILLTHSHWDHMNLAHKMSKEYNIPVYVSDAEKDAYKLSMELYQPLQDQEILLLGDTRILCLLTPGHTLGSMCYVAGKYMLSGDTIFMEGCGLCENYSAAEMMYQSFQRIKREVSREVNVYAGHCYQAENGKSLESLIKNNIYFAFENKEDFISFRMRKRTDFFGGFR